MALRRRRTAAACTLLLALPAAAFLQRRSGPGPRLEGLEVAEGLEATLFAEAPRLTNPTNLDVDARGRVWVVEGYNYRTTLHPDHPVRPEGDRIVILEDTDGDGRADTEKVFYQGRDIDAAMGIAVLGNRVIVSAYGNVFLFTDTDGDDRADEKQVLFRLNNADHDHTVHAFVFGPDGRLYFNVGDEGKFVEDANGKLIVDRAGNPVTSEGKPYRKGMVFRVEPDGSRFEVLGHNFRNPYEVALDSYGTLWQSDNDDDGNRATRVNYVMEYGNYGYTDEVTGAGWRTPRTGMSDSIPLRHWHAEDPGVVPNVLLTGAGSPAGIAVYEGSLLPEVYRNALIHAEPGQNVVRAYVLRRSGAGYTATIVPILRGVEDRFFRPVDVAVAPDGSLFIADWYDPGVGGHNVGDRNQGRIIRVAPKGVPYRVPRVDLSTPAAAAEALRSPNQAIRYLAYTRLAGWGRRAEDALGRLWRSDNPRFRARALWLLAGIPGRGTRYIDQAIRDRDPDIRITGLRAARRLDLDVLPYARRLVDDSSPQVRREVALALRHDGREEAARLWAELALQYDGRDRWYLEALGIGADRQWDRFFAAWRERVGEGWRTAAGRDIVWRARAEAALPLLAELIRDPATPERDRLRYFRAFDFHSGPERERVLLSLLEGSHPAQAEITALALTHLRAGSAAGRPEVRAALDRTLDAFRGTQRFVELAERFEAQDRLAELVQLALARPSDDAGVAAARLALRWQGAARFREVVLGSDAAAAHGAIAALGHAGGAEALGLLEEVALTRDRPLALRRAAVQALGQGPTGQRRLLQLVEEGRLPQELQASAAAVLFASYRRDIREAAARHLPAPTATTADGKTLPPPGVLAQRSGDAARGRGVFARVCAACHRAEGTGIDFGPGLSEIGGKLSKPALYTAILEPSAGISFDYTGYVIRRKDGTEVVGIISSETESELTLRLPGGVTTRYAKSEIVSRRPLDGSLMPDGMERGMTEQELVDLVEYLASLKGSAR